MIRCAFTCLLNFISVLFQLMTMVLSNIFIVLYTTVCLRELVFAMGSENLPSVAYGICLTELHFNWLYRSNDILNCKTFHVANKIASVIWPSTLNQLIWRCLLLIFVPYGHCRASHATLFCTSWSFYYLAIV